MWQHDRKTSKPLKSQGACTVSPEHSQNADFSTISLLFPKAFGNGGCLEIFCFSSCSRFIPRHQDLSDDYFGVCDLLRDCFYPSEEKIMDFLRVQAPFSHPPTTSLFPSSAHLHNSFPSCFSPRIIIYLPILTVLWRSERFGKSRSSLNTKPLIFPAISSFLFRSTPVWGGRVSFWSFFSFLVIPLSPLDSPGVQHILCCVRCAQMPKIY